MEERLQQDEALSRADPGEGGEEEKEQKEERMGEG